MSRGNQHTELREAIARQQAENNELRKDKTQIAEVAARLEAELYAVLSERNVQAAEIERLRAENMGLRRALDVVPGKPTEKDVEWARAALEPKP